ncbi:MAG: cytidine deaminase [Schwartzia sp.]|nr:cytidine deaminase [Schwartzia sp. (in: firmicutes)]
MANIKLTDEEQRLIDEAKRVRFFSYSPYSNFAVGAAVLCDDGAIFGGCNIENKAQSVANCAERTAIFRAVSGGKKDIRMIAVAADTPAPVSPCGACRQVIAEFKIPRIIMANMNDEVKIVTLDELLPFAFSLDE